MRSQVADNNLPKTTLQISIGAMQLPELPMKAHQKLMYLAMALGLEGKCEAFLNPF